MNRQELLRNTLLGIGVSLVPRPVLDVLGDPESVRDLVPAPPPPELPPFTLCYGSASSWVYSPRLSTYDDEE